MSHMVGDVEPGSRRTALWRVGGAYLLMQVLSYVVLQTSCSPYVVGDMWVHGALGPVAAVEAIPRFQYHSVLGNAGFVAGCLAVAGAPFVHVVWPRPATLAASVVGLVVWWLYGLGLTIHHM